MQKSDHLYTQTKLRVGAINMAGIDSLLDAGHTGLAEKHTVAKLIVYVRELEEQLGISVVETVESNKIKVQNGEQVFYICRQ